MSSGRHDRRCTVPRIDLRINGGNGRNGLHVSAISSCSGIPIASKIGDGLFEKLLSFRNGFPVGLLEKIPDEVCTLRLVADRRASLAEHPLPGAELPHTADPGHHGQTAPAAPPTSSSARSARNFRNASGQPFVVEPRPGGNFMLGSRACAEAPTDGYTICMLNNEALAYNNSCSRKFPTTRQRILRRSRTSFFFTTALVVNSSLHVKSARRTHRTGPRLKPKTLAFVAPSMHTAPVLRAYQQGTRHRSGRCAVQGGRRKQWPASCRAPRRSRSSGSRAFSPICATAR